MLGRLDRVGLQAVLPDAFGVGVVGLDGDDAGGAKLGRLFHDEVGARLLDRREHQPQVGRVLLRARLRDRRDLPAAPPHRNDPRQPLALAAVEDGDLAPLAQPHDR